METDGLQCSRDSETRMRVKIGSARRPAGEFRARTRFIPEKGANYLKTLVAMEKGFSQRVLVVQSQRLLTK